jgi:hypothetical protein
LAALFRRHGSWKAEATLTPTERKRLAKRARERQDEAKRVRDDQQARQKESASLAAVGVELIRQRFGADIAELAPYLRVWNELGHLLRGIVTPPSDVFAAGGDLRVIGVAVDPEPTAEVMDQLDGGLASVIADTSVSAAAAAI